MNTENEKGWCPECGIGLNNQEIRMGFCQNCKAHWEPTDEMEDEDDE